jgi:CRP-like cAMP-binding protein
LHTSFTGLALAKPVLPFAGLQDSPSSVPRSSITTQSFLSGLPLFKELKAPELDRIANGTTELHKQRGEVVFNRGDACTGFHLVVYGQIKLAFVSPQGDEKIVEIIGPGYSFGEALMFMDKPYIVMAQALADSMLLHVSKRVIHDEIERDPALARKMLAGLSWRLHSLISDVESYSLQSATERVIGYLLRHDEQRDSPDDTRVLTLSTSKAVVASRLNVTPEHFSRILHELSERGLIDVEGRTIRIVDVEKLRGHHG